jgi:hypothetical protein
MVHNDPIEKNYALTDVSTRSRFQSLLEMLQTDEFVDFINIIANINDFQVDPQFHGAGLDQQMSADKVDIHLDYSIHRLTGKERRVNLIVHLTQNRRDKYDEAIQ